MRKFNQYEANKTLSNHNSTLLPSSDKLRHWQEPEERREVPFSGRILRCCRPVQAGLYQDPSQGTWQSWKDCLEDGSLLWEDQFYTKGDCRLSQCHPLQPGIIGRPPGLRPHALEKRWIQTGRKRIQNPRRFHARQCPCQKRIEICTEGSHLEERRKPIQNKEDGRIQLQKRRLFTHAPGRWIRPALFHLYPEWGRRWWTQWNHRHQSRRHLLVRKRR